MKAKITFLSFFFFSLWATVATAEIAATDLARAKESFTQGKAYFQVKQFEPALSSFREAYQLTKDPALLFNIAQCERLLGEYAAAIKSYRSYLEEVPKTPYRDEIESKVKLLEEALAKATANQPTVPVPTTTAATPAALTLPTEVEAQLKEMEDLISDSQEAQKKSERRVRILIPAGLALAGAFAGGGALLLNANIEESGEISQAARTGRFTMAVTSDVCFVSAGVSLAIGIIRKNKQESPLGQ